MDKMYIKRKSYKSTLSEPVLYKYVEKSPSFTDSHTDPSYFQSTASQVESFMQAGKVLADSRKAVYDFEDGKDDGSNVPPDRVYSELPDVSQALNDEKKRLDKTASEKRKSEKADREHKEILDAVHSATTATIIQDTDTKE